MNWHGASPRLQQNGSAPGRLVFREMRRISSDKVSPAPAGIAMMPRMYHKDPFWLNSSWLMNRIFGSLELLNQPNHRQPACQDRVIRICPAQSDPQ